MQKKYKNRAVTPDDGAELQLFFFPKHVPPISIEAESREEAEKKLAELDKKKTQ